MSLKLSKGHNQGRNIMAGNLFFSTRTIALVEKCSRELLESGIFTGNSLIYFKKEQGLWNLYYWTKNLGYLDYGNSEDKTFKDLLDSVSDDFQGDFDTLIFPNSIPNNPFGGYLTVLNNEGSENLEEIIHSNVRVLAHSNRNRIPHSLENFCFRKGNGSTLKSMMLSCGSASLMASKLNKSEFGYRNWKQYKDDYSMMAITSEDRLGNIYYIKVIFK